jgi:hypothetical protein
MTRNPGSLSIPIFENCDVQREGAFPAFGGSGNEGVGKKLGSRDENHLCQEKGHYFLTRSEMEQFEQIEDHEEEVKFLIDNALPRVLPLWFLVMSPELRVRSQTHYRSRSDLDLKARGDGRPLSASCDPRLPRRCGRKGER